MTMHCPRCGGAVGPPGPDGVLTCTVCGGRLRPRQTEGGSGLGSPAAPATRPEPSPTPLQREEAAGAQGAAGAPPADVQELLSEVRILLQLVLSELKTIRSLQEETLKQTRTRPAAPEVVVSAPPPRLAPAPLIEAVTPASEVWPDQTVASAAPAEVAAPRPASRPRVLLVDDDVGTRDAAARAFETAGFTVDTAGDGNQGLARVGAAKPDLIVLELGIGGELGGEDVITLLKATMDWVDIPIVLHTRVPSDVAEEARTTHGADDVVVKGPASAETLVLSVQAVLQKD